MTPPEMTPPNHGTWKPRPAKPFRSGRRFTSPAEATPSGTLTVFINGDAMPKERTRATEGGKNPSGRSIQHHDGGVVWFPNSWICVDGVFVVPQFDMC